ncbi:Gldg family protein [Mesonia maritima]|uniref:Gldg family protein n=1 Tax=Mesonia maritima TaxID=1793873 RepID=UPI0036318C6E
MLFIADFIKDLREYYYIAPFTLDSVAKTPQQTLQKLKEFDLILEAKPTEKKYTEEEKKYVLDQYLLNGGKALWLAETVNIEKKDSLFNNPQNSALAYPKRFKFN